jgi:tetratricopeptide (TPR) repeat protein
MASAHTVWAFTKMFFEWRWDEAREGFARAIKLEPNYSIAHMGYAHWLTAQGRHSEAVTEISQALALDPHSFFINFVRGMVFFLGRQYGRSLEQFERTHRLKVRFNLNSDLSHYGMSLALEYIALTAKADERERIFERADDEAQTAITLANRHPVNLMHRAHLKTMWGKRDEALILLDEVLELRRGGCYVSPYHLGILYASLGEIARAVECLEAAKEVRDQYLFLAGVDPRLDRLGSNPRFKELLLSIGLENFKVVNEGFN